MSDLVRRSTALLAAGCAIATASAIAATPANATGHRKSVYLHSTSKRQVVGAGSIQPGVVQLHNSGNRAIVLLTKKHAGVDTLVKDLKSHNNKVFSDFSIRGLVMPHHSVWLRVHRGTLYALDAMREHYPASSVHTVAVAGKTVDAPLPYSRAITISNHNVLTVPANTSHKIVFHVVNHSHRTQAVALLKLGSGTSLSDVKAAAADPTNANLGKLDIRDFVELAELGPNQTVWSRYNGAKGNGLVVAIAITGKDIKLFRKGGLGAIHFH